MGADFNPSYVGVRPEIAERVPDTARRILDLGASDGALGAHLLAERPDRRVVGVEIEEQMAAVASRRLSDVYVADLETFDWDALGSKEVFDTLIVADVLEHLRRPDEVLSRAIALLAPGSTVVVSVPNIRHVSALWSIHVRGTFPRRDRGLFDETHLRWFTPADAVRLCADAGLELIEVGCRYRLFDKPGGRVNDALSRAWWLDRVRGVRQLLGYQTIVVGRTSETSDREPT